MGYCVGGHEPRAGRVRAHVAETPQDVGHMADHTESHCGVLSITSGGFELLP